MTIAKQEYILKNWISGSINSEVIEIYHFAKDLLTEYMSIENAISLLWSNVTV